MVFLFPIFLFLGLICFFILTTMFPEIGGILVFISIIGGFIGLVLYAYNYDNIRIWLLNRPNIGPVINNFENLKDLEDINNILGDKDNENIFHMSFFEILKRFSIIIILPIFVSIWYQIWGFSIIVIAISSYYIFQFIFKISVDKNCILLHHAFRNTKISLNDITTYCQGAWIDCIEYQGTFQFISHHFVQFEQLQSSLLKNGETFSMKVTDGVVPLFILERLIEIKLGNIKPPIRILILSFGTICIAILVALYVLWDSGFDIYIERIINL